MTSRYLANGSLGLNWAAVICDFAGRDIGTVLCGATILTSWKLGIC